jgi:hypothetical protein
MSQSKSQTGKSGRKRAAARLDLRLEKRLLSYTVAATASGVAMLAFSPQAEAKVISTVTWIPIAPVSSVTNLDLNNDVRISLLGTSSEQNRAFPPDRQGMLGELELQRSEQRLTLPFSYCFVRRRAVEILQLCHV